MIEGHLNRHPIRMRARSVSVAKWLVTWAWGMSVNAYRPRGLTIGGANREFDVFRLTIYFYFGSRLVNKQANRLVFVPISCINRPVTGELLGI